LYGRALGDGAVTLVVTDMLAAVRAVGGDVKLVGSGRVKVVAPMPLPSDLIERLRASKPELLRLLTSSRLEARPAETWSDAEEERAAIVEYDGGVSRPWAEALVRLDPTRVPPNVSQERWAQFIDDCGRFLDQGWATHAEGLGWGPLDLFGCDRERSPAEGDHAGLLWRQAHHHVRICGHHRDGNRTANDVSPSQQPSRRAGPGVGARSRPGAVRQPRPIYRGLRTSARPAVMPRFIMASNDGACCAAAPAGLEQIGWNEHVARPLPLAFALGTTATDAQYEGAVSLLR
jgi:hypothetical protein